MIQDGPPLCFLDRFTTERAERKYKNIGPRIRIFSTASNVCAGGAIKASDVLRQILEPFQCVN